MSSINFCGGRGGVRRAAPFISLGFLLVLSACGGGGKSDAPQPNPPPPAPPAAPVIGSFTADATSVTTFGTATLTWSASNATSCVAEGGWSGNKSVQGSELIGPLVNGSNTFVLNCTGAGGSVSSQVTVSVANPEGVAWAQLDPRVQVLEPSVTSLIVEVTDTVITFNGSIPLNAGDVIIADDTAYKITAVQELNGQTLATYIAPTIDELFDKLVISGTFSLDGAAPEAAKANNHVRRKGFPPYSSPSLAVPGGPWSLDYEVTNPGITWDGDVALGTTFVADVSYDESQGGFARSFFEVTSTLNASASLRINGERTATLQRQIGFFSVPVPLTVADSILRIVGVRVASIDIPVFAGISVSAEYGYGASIRGSTSARMRLEFGGDLPFESSFNYYSPSFTVPQVSAAPGEDAEPFATASLTTFAYVGASPAFTILRSVALVGVDLKLGPRATSTLQFIPQNEPPYCAQVDMGLRASVNGFVEVLRDRWMTEPSTTDLVSLPPYELGNCIQGTTMTLRLDPEQTPTVFAPLTVHAQVRSSRPMGGDVQITLDGASCSATVTASGAGSCTLTPRTAGTRQVEGVYGSSATAHIPVEIAKASSSTHLSSDPSTTMVGDFVNFVATLTGTSGAERGPTGRVTVRDANGVLVCEAEVGTSQVGTCTARLDTAGAFVFTATYAGDDHYEPSTSAPWTHVVGEPLDVRGKGRVSVGYDTRDSAPCQIFGLGSPPSCRQEQTGAFNVGVSDTVTYPNVGSYTISASARGGAVLDGTVSNGTYTGFYEAHLRNPVLSGATTQAGNGWVLDIVVPRRSNYTLEIDLAIEKNAPSPNQCAAVLIAAFQYLIDGDVEDGQGIGVGAGGNCGSVHNWPAANSQTFQGTIRAGTYRLFMRSGDPIYPDPEDWSISNTEFGSPMMIRDAGTMHVNGTISLTLHELP